MKAISVSSTPNAQTSPQKTRLIRMHELKQRTGMARSTIYAAIKKGTFPKATQLAGKTSAWVEAEIDQWIQDKIDQRNNT